MTQLHRHAERHLAATGYDVEVTLTDMYGDPVAKPTIPTKEPADV